VRTSRLCCAPGQSLHELPAATGKILEGAAYCTDIGHSSAGVGHPAFCYVVANSDLPGFKERERLLIAACAATIASRCPAPCLHLTSADRGRAPRPHAGDQPLASPTIFDRTAHEGRRIQALDCRLSDGRRASPGPYRRDSKWNRGRRNEGRRNLPPDLKPRPSRLPKPRVPRRWPVYDSSHATVATVIATIGPWPTNARAGPRMILRKAWNSTSGVHGRSRQQPYSF